LPRFSYLAPRTVEEACSLLKEYEGNITILAGGTDLLPSMKDRLLTPDYILDLRKVSGLAEIKAGANGEIRIGSLTTLTAIAESPLINEHFPALAQAAGLVGGPAIRNMGTLGGNIALDTRCCYFNQSHLWRKSIDRCIKLGGEICHAVKKTKKCYACFVADTVTALMALNATIVIKGNERERQCHVRDIYTGDGKRPNSLRPEDIITEVLLSVRPGRNGSAYKKLRNREAIDFPLAGVAAFVSLDGGICRDVTIVLSGVDSVPVDVTEIKKILIGKPLTEKAKEEAGNLARNIAHPVANRGSTPEYRRQMVEVFTKLALMEAISRAEQQGGDAK
jgi:4-hydroxybenzoyl-CoA reductase subunit beta